MAAADVAKVAGTALLFAALVLGDGDRKLQCDVLVSRFCYALFGQEFGLKPLTNNSDSNSYLQTLCRKKESPDNFTAQPICKEFYDGCTEDEIKKFATMERGYSALREATSDSPRCQLFAPLRACLDLKVIEKCNVILENKKQTTEGQVEAYREGAENLKRCLNDSAKGCVDKQHAPAILQLNDVCSAMVDLHTYSDDAIVTTKSDYTTTPTTASTTTERNSANRAFAAITVVAALSLSWLAPGFY